MTDYLRDLRSADLISEDEARALWSSGANSAEELYALTLHFAPLYAAVLPGGNLAHVSALASQHCSQAFRNMALQTFAAPLQFAKGAEPPPQAPYPPGAIAPAVPGTPAVTTRGVAAVGTPARIDHHSAVRQRWPVRDQGQRGTCVAHAMAACAELMGRHLAPDVSEQYLYWSAKQLDGSPNDGTWHAFALRALQQFGLCAEADWPYVPTPILGSVHQGPPPARASAAAQSATMNGGGVNAPSSAGTLHHRLLQGPVAIGVPVFADPDNLQRDNWNVSGLVAYGRVAEPPPLSVVVGGHAVCVVGFEPDPNEPAGRGWFIFRNSWGSVFGQALPDARYRSPEPGYGQISWSYVDNYLWEMCWL